MFEINFGKYNYPVVDSVKKLNLNTNFLLQNFKLFEVHCSKKGKFIFQMKLAIVVVVACCVGRQGGLVWW